MQDIEVFLRNDGKIEFGWRFPGRGNQ
jgi:hypothetical protein